MNDEVYEKINERHEMGKHTLTEAALGLASEAGEVAQLVRKRDFEGCVLSTGSMLMELSDVLHYLILACSCYGLTLDELAEINMVKCHARDIGQGAHYEALMWHYDENNDFDHEMSIVRDALEVIL